MIYEMLAQVEVPIESGQEIEVDTNDFEKSLKVAV